MTIYIDSSLKQYVHAAGFTKPTVMIQYFDVKPEHKKPRSPENYLIPGKVMRANKNDVVILGNLEFGCLISEELKLRVKHNMIKMLHEIKFNSPVMITKMVRESIEEHFRDCFAQSSFMNNKVRDILDKFKSGATYFIIKNDSAAHDYMRLTVGEDYLSVVNVVDDVVPKKSTTTDLGFIVGSDVNEIAGVTCLVAIHDVPVDAVIVTSSAFSSVLHSRMWKYGVGCRTELKTFNGDVFIHTGGIGDRVIDTARYDSWKLDPCDRVIDGELVWNHELTPKALIVDSGITGEERVYALDYQGGVLEVPVLADKRKKYIFCDGAFGSAPSIMPWECAVDGISFHPYNQRYSVFLKTLSNELVLFTPEESVLYIDLDVLQDTNIMFALLGLMLCQNLTKESVVITGSAISKERLDDEFNEYTAGGVDGLDYFTLE